MKFIWEIKEPTMAMDYIFIFGINVHIEFAYRVCTKFFVM